MKNEKKFCVSKKMDKKRSILFGLSRDQDYPGQVTTGSIFVKIRKLYLEIVWVRLFFEDESYMSLDYPQV
jgi:hypothetical protein